MIKGGASIVAALVAVYLLVPARAGAWLAGPPHGPIGVVALSLALFAAWCYRGAPASRRLTRFGVAALAVLLAARTVVALAGGGEGWTARYYVGEVPNGQPEWSSDFRGLDATRIDPAVAFKGDTFPAYFLNHERYVGAQGSARAVTEPMAVEWAGFVSAPADRVERFSLTARGAATLAVDGRTLLQVDSPTGGSGTASATLPAGPHVYRLSYRKPAGADAWIELVRASMTDGPALVVMPVPGARPLPAALTALARIADVAALVVLGCVIAVGERAAAAGRNIRRVAWGLFALFGAQGWLVARHHLGHVLILTGGDDWLMYEVNARDVLQHGLLMTFGRPLGQGQPFFIYPFYSYVLALVHALTGEGLFGPIFVQFLILAAVVFLVWRTAALLFDEASALAGLAVLVAVVELDLTRYYTVTLLSENLYILTVALMLAAFVRWVRGGEPRLLWWIGFWGGVSAITRPSMLSYGVPALALVALLARARTHSLSAAAAAVGRVVVAWAAAVAPMTLRNWLVSGRFALITEGQADTFITFNVPPAVEPTYYHRLYPSSNFLNTTKVLARIGWDHPAAFAALQVKKVGFSLGMVHWIPAYRPHPELVVISAAYLALVVCTARMRSAAMWPIHLFVLSHIASLSLTQPWSYGYRLIMPPFMFTTAIAATGLAVMVSPRWSHR